MTGAHAADGDFSMASQLYLQRNDRVCEARCLFWPAQKGGSCEPPPYGPDVIQLCVHVHCTVCANQVVQFRYVTFNRGCAKSSVTIMVSVDKVSRGRMRYFATAERGSRSVHLCIRVLTSQLWERFYNYGYPPSYPTVCTIIDSRASASLSCAKHRTCMIQCSTVIEAVHT